MNIGPGCVVTLAYQIHVIEGEGRLTLIEERTPQNPLDFIYGSGVLLPAVEKAILKQSPGYVKVLRLFPVDAFGEENPKLAMWVPKNKLPKKMDLKVGMKFQTQGPDGEVMAVILKEIKDDEVLLDGNHPLAGAEVQFDLRVMRVRPATPEELASGQVKNLYH